VSAASDVEVGRDLYFDLEEANEWIEREDATVSAE
jgi:hypothetical protein